MEDGICAKMNATDETESRTRIAEFLFHADNPYFISRKIYKRKGFVSLHERDMYDTSCCTFTTLTNNSVRFTFYLIYMR